MTLLLTAVLGFVLALIGLVLSYYGSELFWWFTIPGGIIGAVVIVIGTFRLLST